MYADELDGQNVSSRSPNPSQSQVVLVPFTTAKSIPTFSVLEKATLSFPTSHGGL